MKKILLQTVGMTSLGLGMLGVFLPLLPSTCFILLATWCFSKSSPHFHQWLILRSPFARTINQWQQHRIVPNKVKWLATISLLTSFTISAWFISDAIIISFLAAGMIMLLIFLLTRNSEVQPKNKFMPMHTHQ